MLVVSDRLAANGEFVAVNKVKGDLFMVAGATLYGFSEYMSVGVWDGYILMFLLLANAAEEFLVRQSPLYEVVGQLGMWGTLIIGVQAAVLEHKTVRDVPWNGPVGKFCSTFS